MKNNMYDDAVFLEKYLHMKRSIDGLKGAGEWHEFKKLLPNFLDKSVLDLGCGLGWHCQYAIEGGAKEVVGVDISKKMLDIAKKNTDPRIQYLEMPIEEIDFSENTFDIIISSLAFHYISDYDRLIETIFKLLKPGGDFLFSVEHPIFTAEGSQDWFYNEDKVPLFWPVDNYFSQGQRNAVFLGETIVKYHRTITNYINTLISCGFEIKKIIEPTPDQNILSDEEVTQELRRPMMLIISAKKGE